MATKRISIEKIIIDVEIMAREQINEDHVENLVDAFKARKKLPPVETFFDGENYLLADGFHRFEAAKEVGRKMIEAKIHEGDKREAILFSSSVNAEHGLPRTNKEKRKVVDRLLRDPEWWKWTDRRIAKHCAVSSAFVGNVREELTINGLKSPSERLDSNDRIINVDKIGKRESLDHTPGMPPLAKVPLPVQNLPKQSSTADASETKTNSSVKQRAKIEKGEPKTCQISDAEKSEIREQISEMTSRLQKFDEMLDANKGLTKDRTKKLMNISEEIELRCTGISRFAQDLNSQFD